MTRRTTVGVLSVLMTLGLGGVACAGGFTGFYDFSGTLYTDDFTDVRRGAEINDNGAPDLGGTGHTALNFTGMVGAKGDTWLTKWTPGGSPGVFDGTCFIVSGADVLIHPYNNRKGAGVVTLLNDTNPGDKGLALILYDKGNLTPLTSSRVFSNSSAASARSGSKRRARSASWPRPSTRPRVRA
jgi:hypothetical protein